MNKIISYLSSSRRSTRDLSTNILIITVLTTIFTIINPNFIGNYNLVSIGQTLAPYTILSLGILFPVSLGGIDLSVGATCIGSAVVAGKLYEMGMPLVYVIPVMILFGLLIGILNGFIISKYEIQPFIVTLGTMMFVRGITAIFASEPTVAYPSNCWYNSLFSNCNDFPIGIVWLLLFSFAVYFIFRKTKYGRYFISIGSNEKATQISGVDVNKYKCIGYAISGLMAGIAGIFWSSSFATISVATGNGMELDAVAGVYIGGTSALGGMANVWGSVIGALILVLLRSGLNFALARLSIDINSTYITYVISGIIVVIAVLIEHLRNENSNSRKRKTESYEIRKALTKLVRLALSAILVVFIVLSATNVINLNGAGSARDKTVCLLLKSEGSDFWNSVSEGAESAGKENGYRVICRGTENEDPSYLPKQLEIAESLFSEKPVGMALATLADGFNDYLKKLKKSEIPTIQYDSGLHSKDLEYLSENPADNPLRAYVKADTYGNAGLAAEKTYEAIKDDIANSGKEKYVVGIIQHENSETAALRSKGFEDKLNELVAANPKTAGKVKIITEVKPSANDNAYKTALEYLYEKNVKTVFATALTVSNQLFDAVQASGNKYDKVKFAGYDSSEKVFEWMKSKNKSQMIGVVDQNPFMIGKLTVETLIKIDKNEPIEEEVIVPGVWYDKSNSK